MGMVCAVSFERYGRLYYFDPGPYSPAIGDKVLVPTDDGPEVAECVWAPQWVSEDTMGMPVLAGMAAQADLDRDALIRKRKAAARVGAKRLVREHKLPMKVVGVDHVPETNRTTIYFTAPHRVDFRALVRDLGATLSCRVELRQLSPRDEARVQGGIGSCGRDLCCATFLKDFEPVSIRMAKDQDLPLNPLRISGACGRLLCCLKYEHPLYVKAHETVPPRGSEVDTPEGPGRVVEVNVPSETVKVRLRDGGRTCSCSFASVCAPRAGPRRAVQRLTGREDRDRGQGSGRPLVLQRRDRQGRTGPRQARVPRGPDRSVRHPRGGRARPRGAARAQQADGRGGSAVGGGLLDLVPARRGHFAYASATTATSGSTSDALFARPAPPAPVRDRARRSAGRPAEVVCGPLTGGAYAGPDWSPTALDADFAWTERPHALDRRVDRPPRRDRRRRDQRRLGGLSRRRSHHRRRRPDRAVAALLTLGAAPATIAGIPVQSLATAPSHLWPAATCPRCAAGAPPSVPPT